jgi:DNA-binding winged helix-turn-helix (wHTH) protein/tetratricopeptide (TPR) repeat protein
MPTRIPQSNQTAVYEFGPFRIDQGERLLLRNGSMIPISGKIFDVLLLLVKNGGHLVEKSEMLNQIWSNSFVEESNVAVTISMLRKLLGDNSFAPSYIQTVAKRGYRFVASVKEISDGLRVMPSWAPGPAATTHRSSSVIAERLYAEGRYFWNKRTETGLLRSIDCFQQANRIDPTYPAAFAGLADSYALLASYGVDSPKNAHPIAKAAALQALSLDPNSAEAHTSLGMISFFYEWNWKDAEDHFLQAISLDPSYAMAHTWYAVQQAASKKFDNAIKEIELARDLDTLSLIINTEVGRVFYLCRQRDRAVQAFRRAIDLDPHFARAHSRLGMAFAAQHDLHAAIREFHKVEQLSGKDPYLDGLLGYCYASLGEEYVARELLKKLTAPQQQRFVPAYSVALICVGLMDRSRAIEWLTRSYEDRSTYFVFAHTDPLLDALRSDVQFEHLLGLMGRV